MAVVRIPLTQGYTALIDEEDWELVSKFRWYAKKDPYTVYAAAKGGSILMHRLILGLKYSDQHGIHLDDNGLNNQRYNLVAGDNILNAELRRGKKTHCPQGHAYIGDNVVVKKNGKTICRTCRNQYAEKWRKAHAEK